MRLRPVALAFGLITAWAVVGAWHAWTSTPARGGIVFVLLGLNATSTILVGAIFTFSTARRPPSRRRAREPLAFLACAVALVAVAPAGAGESHAPVSLLLAGDALTALASLWIVASALALGRCFGILPEARGLVTRGPYRVVRHPVYLGEIGAVTGLIITAPSLVRLATLVVFLGAQTVRMGLEEAALTKAFPEYAAYAMRTPRLLPRPAVRPREAALRTLASLLLALLACGGAIGCARQGDPPPTHAPSTHISRHDAGAVARAVAIRAGDLPEFKATAKDVAGREAVLPGEARCVRHARGGLGTVDDPVRTLAGRRWAYARSVQLSAGRGYHSLGAMSDVSVLPTEQAARAVAVDARTMDEACVEHVLRASLHIHLPVRGVVAERVEAKAPGADRAGAYRVIVALRHSPLIVYASLTIFSLGQDVVSLTTYHTSKPVPPAMEERLLGLLLRRARAHGG